MTSTMTAERVILGYSVCAIAEESKMACGDKRLSRGMLDAAAADDFNDVVVLVIVLC